MHVRLDVSLKDLALPYSGPLARIFGLQALSAGEFGGLLAIVIAYVATAEALKSWFYKKGAAARTHGARNPR